MPRFTASCRSRPLFARHAAAFIPDGATLERTFKVVSRVEEAIRTGGVFDFLAHPSCLVVEDPTFEAVKFAVTLESSLQ